MLVGRKKGHDTRKWRPGVRPREAVKPWIQLFGSIVAGSRKAWLSGPDRLFIASFGVIHCGAAFTFVASFTGGSILIFGPWTLGRTPAPGFSMSR